MKVLKQNNWTKETPCCIYTHISPSGKVYIGQTRQKYLSSRWEGGRGYKRCKIFFRAIQKYGWDNFQHIMLYDGLTPDEANSIECELIAEYKSKGMSYNSHPGGEGKRPTPINKRVWVNNGIVNKLIDENLVCPEGFRYGMFHANQNQLNLNHSKTIKNRIFVNDGINCKMIHPDELDGYLSKGWIKGRIGFNPYTNVGKIYITRNKQNKMIHPDELDGYLSKGWIKGEYKNINHDA